MLKQIEGSQAVAETVALCRPEVICAYPISPQTHIVEGLSAPYLPSLAEPTGPSSQRMNFILLAAARSMCGTWW